MSCADFLCNKITDIEAIIDALIVAQTTFAQNEGIQSYTLDTGQTRQTVTRFNLEASLFKYLSLHDTLCARCSCSCQHGSSAIYGSPLA